RMNEYREIVLAGDSISPSDAARELQRGCGKNDWLPGPVPAGVPLPLSTSEVAELYATHATTKPHDEQFINAPFPSPEEILKPHEFTICVQSMDIRNDQNLLVANRAYWGKTSFTTNHTRQVSVLADSLSNLVADFKSMQLWQIAAMEA